MSEIKALQRTSRFKKEKLTVDAENYIMWIFIIFTLHIILLYDKRNEMHRNVHAW
jgi:hypothetical protein